MNCKRFTKKTVIHTWLLYPLAALYITYAYTSICHSLFLFFNLFIQIFIEHLLHTIHQASYLEFIDEVYQQYQLGTREAGITSGARTQQQGSKTLSPSGSLRHFLQTKCHCPLGKKECMWGPSSFHRANKKDEFELSDDVLIMGTATAKDAGE